MPKRRGTHAHHIFSFFNPSRFRTCKHPAPSRFCNQVLPSSRSQATAFTGQCAPVPPWSKLRLMWSFKDPLAPRFKVLATKHFKYFTLATHELLISRAPALTHTCGFVLLRFQILTLLNLPFVVTSHSIVYPCTGALAHARLRASAFLHSALQRLHRCSVATLSVLPSCLTANCQSSRITSAQKCSAVTLPSFADHRFIAHAFLCSYGSAIFSFNAMWLSLLRALVLICSLGFELEPPKALALPQSRAFELWSCYSPEFPRPRTTAQSRYRTLLLKPLRICCHICFICHVFDIHRVRRFCGVCRICCVFTFFFVYCPVLLSFCISMPTFLRTLMSSQPWVIDYHVSSRDCRRAICNLEGYRSALTPLSSGLLLW